MRDVKFRVWDITKKKMLYFNNIFNEHPWTERSTFPQYESFPELHKISDIMQFTGLQDKNGKDIYEGDKVRIDSVLDEILVTDIYFDKSAFRYRHQDGSGSVIDTTKKVKGYEKVTQDFEIIGNIHD